MSKESHKKRTFFKRKPVIIIGIVIVIIAVVAGGWFMIWQMVKPTPEPQDEFSRERQLDSIASDAEQKAQESGNAAEGAKVYDDAISKTDDQAEKSQLMASKATVYLNDGNYDEALKIALEADKLHESSEVSALVAQIYEVKGDKAKAAEYYEKAARLVNVNEPMGLSDKEYYEGKVRELRGGQ